MDSCEASLANAFGGVGTPKTARVLDRCYENFRGAYLRSRVTDIEDDAAFRPLSKKARRWEVSMEEMLPKFGYYLDESDPDVVVLRRQDGAFVAAFSARGVTTEGVIEAAKEDYRRLIWHQRVGEERVSFLDELPEHAAIVDGSGTIVAVNEAWKRFARDNGADLGKVLEGANYLDICEMATGEQAEYARPFAEGLRSVLLGREERFAMEYPCHSPTEKCWFVARVGRLAENDSPMALVAHENITRRKLVPEQ